MASLGGRYTIVRSLGRGGAGEVFEAHDEELGQQVAVKVLRPGSLGDPRRLERLRSEIATAQRITHPAVCRVFDLDASAGLYTMELLEGETLAARIARGPLTIDEALPIVEQLCAGVAAAHDAGVVHRDLKPHNVMLCGKRAVITDFGLAVVLEANASEPTLDLAGSAAYAAPEQLIGGETSPAVDVYALGVTMFEMVTGRTPFDQATPLSTALARIDREPPSARALVPGLDRRWDTAIRKCMAREPAARPAVHEIVPALRGPRPGAGRRWLLTGAAALLVLGTTTAALLTRGDRDGTSGVIETHDAGVLARVLRLDGAGKEMIEAAVRDPEGNLYVTGHVSAGSRLGEHRLEYPGEGALAGYVAKIGRDGRLVWERIISSGARTATVALALDGDLVVVAGKTNGGSLDLGDGPVALAEGGESIVLALSASDGRTRWGRRTGSASNATLRVAGIGPDGNVYVAGGYKGTLELGNGEVHRSEGASPFVVSYDRTGRVRWALGGTGGGDVHMRALAFRDRALVIAGDGSGAFELGGARWQHGPLARVFIAALDLDGGRLRWLRDMPASSATLRAIAPTGPLVVAGSFGTTIDLGDGRVLAGIEGARGWLTELEPSSGSIRWARAIGASENNPRALAALPDGRLVLAGTYSGRFTLAGQTLTAEGVVDLYLALLGPLGEELAVVSLHGPAREQLRDIRVDGDMLALWGNHQGLALGATTLPAAGFTDGFYAELRVRELGLLP